VAQANNFEDTTFLCCGWRAAYHVGMLAHVAKLMCIGVQVAVAVRSSVEQAPAEQEKEQVYTPVQLDQQALEEPSPSSFASVSGSRVRCCCKTPPGPTCLPMENTEERVTRQSQDYVRASSQTYDNPGPCIKASPTSYSLHAGDREWDHDRCCLRTKDATFTSYRHKDTGMGTIPIGKTRHYNKCVEFEQLYTCSSKDDETIQTGQLYEEVVAGQCLGEKQPVEGKTLVRGKGNRLECPQGHFQDEQTCLCEEKCG